MVCKHKLVRSNDIGAFYLLLNTNAKNKFTNDKSLPLIKGQKVGVIDSPTVFLGPLSVIALFDHNLKINKIYYTTFIYPSAIIKHEGFDWKSLLKTKCNNGIFQF